MRCVSEISLEIKKLDRPKIRDWFCIVYNP